MKCDFCGYDKIQPNFNYCPKCKRSLKEQYEATQVVQHKDQHSQEKGFINRAIHHWTYERAVANPREYANWAYHNPNDSRVFINRWERAGMNVNIITDAINEANRARLENPTADMVDVDANIIASNQRSARRESIDNFEQITNADYTTNAATIVRNKAIWKLQSGELARHIAPDEWVYVSEHLEGLVIEEGTSAIIYVDGQEVAQMGSGMYLFDDRHAAAAEMEAERRNSEHQEGILSRITNGIYRLFTGHKREDSSQQREERRRRVRAIMGRLKKDTIISVYLKSDRVFPAVFGQQHLPDSLEGYQPYVIQSRHLDVLLGVSMQMRIGDFKEFIANYFVGCKTVSIADVVKSGDSAVLSILRYHLRNIEVSERGLDEMMFRTIKEHLMSNLSHLLHGITIIDVLDIATSNKQLARFRQVEEQLYCSEREYDFLQRTNEFRNRIASEENDQKIREARSEQELRVRLDEVNKDNLLHTDEMEQFVSLLMNQKAVREASNEASLDKALLEIKRNALISQEEFEIFNSDLINRRFEREQVSEQLRARSLTATALQKIELDKTFALDYIQAKDEVSDAEWESLRKRKNHEAERWDLEAIIYGRRYVLERQQLVDEVEKRRLQNEAAAEIIKGQQQIRDFGRDETLKDHDVNKIIRDDQHEFNVRVDSDTLDLLKKKIEIQQSTLDHTSKRAIENLHAIKEMEMAEIKESHTHELELGKIGLEKDKIAADVEKTRIQTEGNMSADQLMGKNIASMGAEAQKAFAESFSNLREIELTKMNAEQQAALYQQMVNMANANGVNLQKMASDNAAQQMETMREMIQAFKEVNISATGGQQNVVNSMVGAMQNFANTRFNDAKDIKEEYRTQMQHEQERIDNNQDRSLNYTTRVKVAENMPNMVGGTSVNVHVGATTCPICGQQIDDKGVLCCPFCGQDLK